MYRLLLHPNIKKQLARIPKPYARRMADEMRALRANPRPESCKHLTEELYRLRIGDYRILYADFDSEQVVFVGKIARGSEKAYRDLAAILAAARKAVST